MTDVNIIQIAIGVFIGNVSTLAAWWALKDMSRPDQENMSYKSLITMILIVGLATLGLLVQKLEASGGFLP